MPYQRRTRRTELLCQRADARIVPWPAEYQFARGGRAQSRYVSQNPQLRRLHVTVVDIHARAVTVNCTGTQTHPYASLKFAGEDGERTSPDSGDLAAVA